MEDELVINKRGVSRMADQRGVWEAHRNTGRFGRFGRGGQVLDEKVGLKGEDAARLLTQEFRKFLEDQIEKTHRDRKATIEPNG